MILCVDYKELVAVELSEVVVQAKLKIPSTLKQFTINGSLRGYSSAYHIRRSMSTQYHLINQLCKH